MEVLILLLLIAFNGMLVMSEMAMIASRRVRLERAAERGSRGAASALLLAGSPTRFLSAIQIGITLIGIIVGAVGEATLSERLEGRLSASDSTWLARYATPIATTTVVLCITYVSVVLGELIPKRLALANPERIASLAAPPMTLITRFTGPFVGFLSVSTNIMMRLLGVKEKSSSQDVTEDDIRSLIARGTETGIFAEKERELVERIFRLGDQRVSALMVPRTDIVWLEADAPAERVRVAVAAYSHSHFPVCRKGLENLLGVVHLKDLVKAGLLHKTIDLKVLARQPRYVPESMPALRLLEEFRRGQTHIAFVLDEYGVLAGLITLNDIVESILGHMVRAGEDAEPLVVRREDGSLLLDGALPVGDLKELLGVERLPHQDRTTFNTLAGFIMTYLGRVPQTGEAFTWFGYRFEIVDMDRHRIDKVLLTSKDNHERPEPLHNEAPE